MVQNEKTMVPPEKSDMQKETNLCPQDVGLKNTYKEIRLESLNVNRSQAGVFGAVQSERNDALPAASLEGLR